MKISNLIQKSLAWLCAVALCAGTAGSIDPETINPKVFAAGDVLHSADFESGTGGWTSFGSSSVASSTAAKHNGNASLFVSGRTDSWNGAACDMASVMESGETYQFDTWAMQNASSSETIQLMAKYTNGSGDQYVAIAESAASKGTWIQLDGELKLPSDASGVLIYFQTSGTTTDFYVDDVTITGAASWSTAALDETPLKDIYANYFKIGCAATTAELSTVISQDVVKHHFNSLTVGNEMKPDYILDKQASQASGSNVNPAVSLDQAASVLKFCEDNNISVRGHVLLWFSQTPDWFFRENFSDSGAYVSKSIMSQRLENYIKNVMAAMEKEFPKLDVYSWDVVNECYMDDGSLRPSGTDTSKEQSKWTMIYGNNSYIEEAFTYARKYAPADSKLFYNDYNEYIEKKRDAIYNMASSLKSKGLIDGIGMQSHLDVGYPSTQLYRQAIDKYSQLGLEIQITELDITQYNNNGDLSKQTAAYKSIMQEIVDAKRDGANITAVVFWGITDGTSWRKDGAPLLFDADYAPKDSYYAVANLIDKSEWGDGSNPEKPDDSTLKGDVDADGDADIEDVKLLQKYLVCSVKSVSDMEAADVISDGKVNVFDLSALKKIVGKGNADVTTTTTTKPAVTTTTTTTTKSNVNYKLVVPVSGTAAIDVGTTKEVETITLKLDTSTDYILHVNVGFWSAWCNIQCENGVLKQVDTEQNIGKLSISGNTVTITLNDGVYASVDESKSAQAPYAGKITLHHNSGSYDIGVIDYNVTLGEEKTSSDDSYVDMSELEGWATVEGDGLKTTTGGAGGEVVVVKNLSEFTAVSSDDTPRIIVVDGVIQCTDRAIRIGSNKTVVGANAKAEIKGGLEINTDSNIIVANLTIDAEYPNGKVADCFAARNTHHLWVTHVTLHDAPDGLLDLTVGSNYLTVSWCKFYYDDTSNGHRLVSLTSNGTTADATDTGRNKVTYHHNWWAQGCDQRMPRILFGQGHVYNNYYTAEGNTYCVGVGCYASVLVENNYFKNVKNPHQFMYTHARPCYITANGNVYDNTTGSKDTGHGGSAYGNVAAFTDPPYEYTLDNAKDIPSIVQKGAGPQ